jgi:hypothetical protein
MARGPLGASLILADSAQHEIGAGADWQHEEHYLDRTGENVDRPDFGELASNEAPSSDSADPCTALRPPANPLPRSPRGSVSTTWRVGRRLFAQSRRRSSRNPRRPSRAGGGGPGAYQMLPSVRRSRPAEASASHDRTKKRICPPVSASSCSTISLSSPRCRQSREAMPAIGAGTTVESLSAATASLPRI